MKKIISILVAAIALLQCKKSEFNDLGGPETLKGVMVVYDTLSGVITPRIAKNAKVYLRYSGNPNVFINSVTTSDLGKYTFNGISRDSSYIIYASTDTGTAKNYGELPVTASSFEPGHSDTLKLYPAAFNQNVLHLVVHDAQSGPVSNVTAWVFNSPVLFAADTSLGKVFDMVTNPYGVSNLYNLAPGMYYLRIKTTIGNIRLAGEASVMMDPTGIKNVPVTLQTNPLPRNGVEVTVTDHYTTPVNNAKIYFYRSMSVFLADTIQYNNSLFSLTTNASGFAATYVMEPATYFVRTIKQINSETLVKIGSVTVGTSGISQLPLQFP